MRRARPLGKGGEPKIDFGVPWSWVYCDRREIPEDVFRRMSEEQREEALLWRHPVYAGSGEPVKGWDGRDIGELVKGNGAEPIIPRSEYLQGIDPLRYCYKLPGWDDVLEEWDNYKIIIIFGGNRSGKSNFGAAVSSWMARNVPGFKGVSWSPTDATSIETPQSLYHYYLPEDYRDPVKERGRYMSLTYSQKNGFSDHKCILPPVRRGYGGSEMRFLNYASYGRHSGVAQGWNAHLVHCDEQLPKKLMSDMISRTSDVNGKILWTYTTLDGWVPSVAEVLHKAETLESRYAPLVREDLPVKQVSRHIDSCLIVYWWTQDNLFIINELRQLLEGLKTRPRAEQLAVAYGVVTKSATTKFPLFSRETNVVKHETIPFIEDPSVPHTVYQSLDPAGRKNWYWLYAGVTENADNEPVVWIFAEWPDSTYGQWALPGDTIKGVLGPAAKGLGYGHADYVERMEEIEADFSENPFVRFIDPRGGKAASFEARGVASHAEKLSEYGLLFEDASGKDEEYGIQRINDYLFYDTGKPIAQGNSPRLYVSDRCEQLINSLLEYTAEGGKDEATKDPCDALRYLCISEPLLIDLDALVARRPGGY